MSEDARIMVVGVGPNDMVGAQVDQTQGALRVSIRPLEHQGLIGGVQGGHFRLAASYSNTAAKPAAGSDVFSLRWFDSVKQFVLKNFTLWVATTTTYTASLIQDAVLYRASGFTVSPSGGTAISIAAGGRLYNAKMANSCLATGGTAIAQISSGDLLTTGTRTLDTYPLGYMSWLNPITTVNAPTGQSLFDADHVADHPCVLGQNEGLVLQTPIGNAQAAGVSKWTVVIDWAEVAGY